MYWGQLPKGGEAWTVCDLGGGEAWQERGECRF